MFAVFIFAYTNALHAKIYIYAHITATFKVLVSLKFQDSNDIGDGYPSRFVTYIILNHHTKFYAFIHSVTKSLKNCHKRLDY